MNLAATIQNITKSLLINDEASSLMVDARFQALLRTDVGCEYDYPHIPPPLVYETSGMSISSRQGLVAPHHSTVV